LVPSAVSVKATYHICVTDHTSSLGDLTDEPPQGGPLYTLFMREKPITIRNAVQTPIPVHKARDRYLPRERCALPSEESTFILSVERFPRPSFLLPLRAQLVIYVEGRSGKFFSQREKTILYVCSPATTGGNYP
jgi:hypothetical protein